MKPFYTNTKINNNDTKICYNLCKNMIKTKNDLIDTLIQRIPKVNVSIGSNVNRPRVFGQFGLATRPVEEVRGHRKVPIEVSLARHVTTVEMIT